MRKNHKLFFFCHAELASASLPADATHQALQAGRFITEEKRSRNGFDKLTILSLSKDKFGMTKKKFGMTREKGITLVELLIDIGFVIVLLVGAFMLFNPLDLLKMANDNRRKEDLAAIQNALEQYHKDLGSYPSSTPDYQIKTIDANDPVKEWGSSWGSYMSVIPKDPSSPKKTYIYMSGSAGQTYYLYASLEKGDKDKKACNLGKSCSGLRSNSVSDTACRGVCNYGVSSSNVIP